MDYDTAKRRAKEIWDSGQMGTWSEKALFICLRDDFCCVYCGRYLLEDRHPPDFACGDIFNYFTHLDHLLPKSRYPALENEECNLVLSCVPCNRRKRDWEDASKLLRETDRPLTDQDRKGYIEGMKSYLEPLGRLSAELFQRQRDLIYQRNPELVAKAEAYARGEYMGTPLEERLACTKCGKKFKVTGDEPLNLVIQDLPLIVNCPSCGWPNVAEWRKGVAYSVCLEEP